MPGYWVPIKRSRKIRIKAVGENGNKIKFKARGFLARVLQHETDHLNGITIRDRNTLNAKFNLRPELRPRENQNAK